MKTLLRLTLALTADFLRAPLHLTTASAACESIAWKLR